MGLGVVLYEGCGLMADAERVHCAITEVYDGSDIHAIVSLVLS